MTKETGGTVSVNHPSAAEPSPTAVSLPTAVTEPTQSTVPAAPAPTTAPHSLPTWVPPTVSPGVSTGVTVPDPNAGDSASAGYTSQVAAQAPAQLTCTNKHAATADPFLVAPFQGWTDINSFVDHDLPDYAVDGRIILANGLIADASEGQESDFFPAYWSPALRQFVSYDGHNGYDFGISYQPVLAAAAGTVMFAGWNGPSPADGYGQMILINHHNGYVTLYGHLSKLEVQQGDRVTAGQEIAISGDTGRSTGPHLHFSVFHNCAVTDPYGWTGPGVDPLETFNGERSHYLWLPGHDPLVLNPPPKWPAYPAGLKIAPNVHVAPAQQRTLPLADRLLLLDLPRSSLGDTPPNVALARSQALIQQEAEHLVPYLRDLVRAGLIQSWQFVPSTAAIWVRGSASAAQLESLPGVASLSGVQPEDLQAAQAGFAHAILIQTSAQQAPSLWPIGFRSSLATWRPIAAINNGQAAVTGSVVPGERISVALTRRGRIIAQGTAVGDAESGGFVATLRNGQGLPVPARDGDVLHVNSAEHSTKMTIQGTSLRAHLTHLDGQAPSGSDVVITATGLDGSVLFHRVLVAHRSGRYHLRLPLPLPPGTLVVATVADSAGSHESAATFTPGLRVTLGQATVNGWVVGHHPVFQFRRGALHLTRVIHPDSAGHFEIELSQHGLPLALQAGDQIALGPAGRVHLLRIPAVHLSRAHGRLTIAGQLRAQLAAASLGPLSPDSRGKSVITSQARSLTLTLDPACQLTILSGQDQVALHLGSGTISGATAPGGAITVTTLDQKGVPLETAAASGDDPSGAFSTSLKARLQSGTTVIIRGRQDTALTLPPFHAAYSRTAHLLSISGQKGLRGVVRGELAHARPIWSRSFTLPAQLRLPSRADHALRLRLRVFLPGNISLERIIRLIPARKH